MDIATLKAEKREPHGTRAARRLRQSGRVPAIIYGHGETPEAVTIPAHEFSRLLEHGAHLLELQVDGSPRNVLIKDVQYDHLGKAALHVDFARIDLNERVKVKVPLEFRGTPVGVNEGGSFESDMLDLEIECFAREIPDSIRVNVSALKIGDVLHVREIELPANMIAVASGDSVVCAVREQKTAAATPETTEEGPAQPEIIGRKEKEEESEDEGK